MTLYGLSSIWKITQMDEKSAAALTTSANHCFMIAPRVGLQLLVVDSFDGGKIPFPKLHLVFEIMENKFSFQIFRKVIKCNFIKPLITNA